MHEKTGRERQLVFHDTGFGDPGEQWMFGMVLEIGERVLDQVEHLPAAVMNASPAGSYLSPARIVVHLVGNELRELPLVAGPFDPPDYTADVQEVTAAELLTMKTDHLDTAAILRKHVAFRRKLILERCHKPGLLDEPIDHPLMTTKRDAVGKWIWHWSFHSGHIGAVTLELGYEYVWTTARPPGA
jgi:hypothetical protein